MAFYLDFGVVVDGYVTLGVSAPADASIVDLEVDVFVPSSADRQAVIHGWGAGHIEINRFGAGIVNAYFQLDGTWTELRAPTAITLGQRHTLRITYDGVTGDIALLVDGAVVDTATGTGGNLTIVYPYYISAYDNTPAARDFYFAGRLYSATLNVDGLVYTYDANASGGTGSLLIETTRAQNGTLVNFPINDSQWVRYPSIPTSLSVSGITPDSARLAWEQS